VRTLSSRFLVGYRSVLAPWWFRRRMIAFGEIHPALLTVGLFIFQMTMPITLVAVYLLLPGRPRSGFRLETAWPILWVLPNLFPFFKSFYHPNIFLILILLSAAMMYAGLYAMKRAVPMKF